ncbi:MAG TPA: TAXI family TRAP transporter solute-binding subunit [Bryobacteraceae bacterium]|nr:TAXI family TRAP transporter solute-binding subunit [Bryobacteraceae bacterium]
MQNATDIVFARGVDGGIVQSDVLDALKRDPPFPGIEKYLQYITKLHDEELHILAGPDIHSIEDLASKKVNLGLAGSGTSITATAIFGALGVTVDATGFPQPVALEKLRRGEISVLVCLTPKPARLFRDIRPDENLHFLSIGATTNLPQSYTSATLTAQDYPELIEANAPVATVAVGTVLAAYNWPAGSERYQNVAHVVQAFFDLLRDFQAPPHHPKWRDINVAASLPGWTRFAPAEEWIKKAGLDNREQIRRAGLDDGVTQSRTSVFSSQERNAIFNEFAAYQKQQAQGKSNTVLNPQQRDALFKEFADYQKQLAQGTRNPALDPLQRDALFKDFADSQERLAQWTRNVVLDPRKRDAFLKEYVEYSAGKFLQ